MRYVFDYFELVVLDDLTARVFRYGSKHGSENYSISVKAKNWLEVLITRCPDAKQMPNIVLRKSSGGIKISFYRKDGIFYRFNSSRFIGTPLLGVGESAGYVEIKTLKQLFNQLDIKILTA